MNQVKKPWPNDCVVIVAALSGTENRGHMQSAHDGKCLECDQPVSYDGWTYKRCEAMPARAGRPIKFLCPTCFPLYNFRDVTHFEDHRFPKKRCV